MKIRMLLKRNLTNPECLEWFSNPNKNPLTKRNIKINGSVFKLIKKNCNDKNPTLILNPNTNRFVIKTGITARKFIIQKLLSYNYYNQCELKLKTIEELIYLYENKCNNISLIWENNSCYIDSLFVALFHKKNKFIEDVILNANINNYNNNKLFNLAIKIKKELNKIYIFIYQKSSFLYQCSHLRKLLQDYYNLLIKINPNKKIPDIQNWINEQNDVYELFQLLFERIFNIPENSIKIKDNNNIIYSNFMTELPLDFILGKKEINLNSIYPIYSQTYNFDNNNKYVDENGISHTSFTKTYELLKADAIFIRVIRNIGNEKINTRIIPPLTLKLKENKYNLYLSSLIIHEGTSTGGHYTCIFICNDKWYLYNDISGVDEIGSYQSLITNKKIMKNIVGIIYSN